MMAIMAAIIASVEPQQMVISRSGSYLTPWVRSNFSTMASRSGFAPQVMAYWLMSSAMALRAASLISSGAAKSGNPCDRLTAPYFIASRVISRMTDSVNWLALRETRREIDGAGVVIELATDGHGLGQIGKRDQLFHLVLSVSICVNLWLTQSGDCDLSCSTIDRTAGASEPFGARRR